MAACLNACMRAYRLAHTVCSCSIHAHAIHGHAAYAALYLHGRMQRACMHADVHGRITMLMRCCAACPCDKKYAPVCDTKNNVTYGNACTADCAGVYRPTTGACGPKKPGADRMHACMMMQGMHAAWASKLCAVLPRVLRRAVLCSCKPPDSDALRCAVLCCSSSTP